MRLHCPGHEIEVACQAVGLGPVTQQLAIAHHGSEPVLECTAVRLSAYFELLRQRDEYERPSHGLHDLEDFIPRRDRVLVLGLARLFAGASCH